MGGNALKHLNVERKSASDYHRICSKVVQLCTSFCTRAATIPAYRNKLDFGDADILIIPNCNETIVKDTIQDVFSPRLLLKNGECYSFDYENFQIDLIVTTNELFDASYNYYSYNDLGNLIGRIAHKFGLKYGHVGLCLPVRKDDSHLGEIIHITTDTRKSLTFLGYDADKFFQGFDSLLDVFDFACSTPYFNKDIFSFENLNHINRVRNRKRKVYTQFLDYIKTKDNVNHFEFNPNKKEYLPQIAAYFPEVNIYNRLLCIENNMQLIKQRNLKFNGEKIKTITQLSGKELGLFIRNFKQQWQTDDNFIKWIDSVSCTEIDSAILLFYNTQLICK